MIDDGTPERPRFEPEIIPPDGSRRRGAPRYPGALDAATFTGEAHRIYVGRIGPVGIALLLLIAGILAAIIFVAALGAFLIWIPIIALIVAAGAIFRLLRR